MGANPKLLLRRTMARTGVWKKDGSTFKKVVAIEKKSTGKSPRFYAPEDVKAPLAKKATNEPTKLRPSITPGTVLILLAGHFKGQRVVFLKQLDSGLLLITGPYSINGVPLRRVPQSYVISTQTKIDISGVAIPAEVNDEMFKKPKVAKKKNDETFFEKEKTSEGVSDARKALQKKVDDKVVAEAGKTPLLKEYLSSKFSLKKGDKPHLMTF